MYKIVAIHDRLYMKYKEEEFRKTPVWITRGKISENYLLLAFSGLNIAKFDSITIILVYL